MRTLTLWFLGCGPTHAISATQATTAGSQRKGLTFHEKQEFAGMEARILAAEEAVDTLQAQLNDPDVAGDHERLHATYEAHREAQDELDRLFARWEELERKHLGE